MKKIIFLLNLFVYAMPYVTLRLNIVERNDYASLYDFFYKINEVNLKEHILNHLSKNTFIPLQVISHNDEILVRCIIILKEDNTKTIYMNEEFDALIQNKEKIKYNDYISNLMMLLLDKFEICELPDQVNSFFELDELNKIVNIIDACFNNSQRLSLHSAELDSCVKEIFEQNIQALKPNLRLNQEQIIQQYIQAIEKYMPLNKFLRLSQEIVDEIVKESWSQEIIDKNIENFFPEITFNGNIKEYIHKLEQHYCIAFKDFLNSKLKNHIFFEMAAKCNENFIILEFSKCGNNIYFNNKLLYNNEKFELNLIISSAIFHIVIGILAKNLNDKFLIWLRNFSEKSILQKHNHNWNFNSKVITTQNFDFNLIALSTVFYIFILISAYQYAKKHLT